jgi:hypothetical protein
VNGGRCLPPLISAIFQTLPNEYPARVESKEIVKATADEILFVCIKNARRSPMRQALLKMSAKRGLKVCSAGIKPGKAVHKEAVEAMREVGD